MPERPADVWAGKAFFVKKHCSDDAGHDTRVVTTLGVADDEDWFAKGTALSANINCQALCRRPSPTFSSRTLRCARSQICFPRPPRENLLTKMTRETMHRLPGA